MVIQILNLCPVCGYHMQDAPQDYNICPCCGTEFGVSDLNASTVELRETWLKNGVKWWSPVTSPPQDWNPFTQLQRILSPSGLVINGVVFSVESDSSGKSDNWPTLGLMPEVVYPLSDTKLVGGHA